MDERFMRTEMLLGEAAMERLSCAHVAVFGIGGVGSYTAEALVRGGIGALTFIDGDTVSFTNINRQLIACEDTVGFPKTLIMRKRALNINPKADITALVTYYEESTAGKIDLLRFDYIADAIDTVPSKLLLTENAKKAGVPVISSMGAGNKLDPTAFSVADIYSTSVCPLAKIMRRELKKRGIDSLKVVYSKEEPITPQKNAEDGKKTVGSVSFTPSVCGLIMAGEIIKDLIREETK